MRNARTSSAEDLGAARRDNSHGYGLVRAKNVLDALAAMNPGGGNVDTVAPVITNVASLVMNAKNGSFESPGT